MIDVLKTAIDEDSSVTAQDDGDAPDSQYRLGTSDSDDARMDTKEDESTDVPSEPDAGEATKPPLEIDQVFAILKNQRRRYVLEYLLNTGSPVPSAKRNWVP